MHFYRGEKVTAASIADAIAENRAELVHHPSTLDLHLPFPSKECPSCDGSVRTKTLMYLDKFLQKFVISPLHGRFL